LKVKRDESRGLKRKRAAPMRVKMRIHEWGDLCIPLCIIRFGGVFVGST